MPHDDNEPKKPHPKPEIPAALDESGNHVPTPPPPTPREPDEG